MRQSEQAQFRLTAAEEQPGPQSLLPLTVQNNEETAETGRALSLHGDRTAEIERALSRETNSGLPNPRFSRRAAAWWPNSLRRRTVEIERTLSLHADRMAGIERALSLHGDRTAEIERALSLHGDRTAEIERALSLHGDRTAEIERALSLHGDRTAGIERALSLHGDRTVEIEHTLSLHGDRLDGLNARAADLNWEIRWDQTRTDFALGAIEGMTNEIDRFQEERRKEDFQAVFEQAEPLVSVCVATADRASLLFERCIPSLLAQTYQNLQIVVVGDHCTDDTEHRFAELRDDRVTFVNLTQRGPYPPSGRERWCVAGSNAMNAALEQCKGHFITHLDDDDRYVSNRIERLVHACLEQKAEFCWHPFWAEREDGNWDMIGDGRFAVNQVNPGAVFYHRYFARFRWDPLAYQIDEPGDWNRFRKIKMLGPKRLFVAEPLLHHHRERQQPNDSERFADC